MTAVFSVQEAARLAAFAEERRKHTKIDYVKWNKPQRRFLDCKAKALYNRSGNQGGKSYGAAGLASYTLTGRYPDWWQGFVPKVRQASAFGVVVWVLSTTSQMCRDAMQQHLLGEVASGMEGTGLIPKDCIVSIQPSRGIAGAVDYCVVRRTDGALAKVAFKSYEQGRASVQAESVDLVICDELLTDAGMWSELQARTTATGGILRMVATERGQGSEVARWFKDNAGPDVLTFTSSLDDADHLTAEEKAAIRAMYKDERELACRYYGLAWAGQGTVWTKPWEEVSERIDPSTFPVWYKLGLAIDPSHFGQSATSSQFACVALAFDPQTGVAYLYDAFKLRGTVPEHVAAINARGHANLPVAWPHDMAQGASDGKTIAGIYKSVGLAMLPSHVTLPGGGYSLEASIAQVDDMLIQGKLRLARHLTQLEEEYRAFERDDSGKIIKRFDDLTSAMRYGCMALKQFKPVHEIEDRLHRRNKPRFAQGLDFNLFATNSSEY